MAIERRQMSVSQFSELMGIEPRAFIGVEVNRQRSTVTLVVEGDDMQTVSTFPQLASNASYGKGGKGTAKTPKVGGAKKA